VTVKNSKISAPSLLAALLALLLAGYTVLAQTQQTQSGTSEYTPTVGQPGKDVIWVPTPDELVERMLQMAGVGPRDYVIDLGSGDGRTVIMAAEKFGARALGIEYNPEMVALSIRKAEEAGVSNKAKFVKADIFESDFSQATVITMYLLPRLNLKLRPILLELRPGTRLVSHAFNMEDWEPDEEATVEGRNAYLWIVPAKVAGSWDLKIPTDRGEETWTLTMEQEFQMVTGRLRFPDGSSDSVDGRVRGPEFRLDLVAVDGSRREIEGRAFGDRLAGTLRDAGGVSRVWSAVRAEGTPRT
jgi:SAM-dependent methyltransferase